MVGEIYLIWEIPAKEAWAHLNSHGELNVTGEVREQLCRMGAETINRLQQRRGGPVIPDGVGTVWGSPPLRPTLRSP